MPFAANPIASGRHEFRLKLLRDSEDQDSAGAGFGFVTPGAMNSELLDTDGGDGLWWLRRFETTVYTGVHGAIHHMNMPEGAEVRMVLDMHAKEATFFVDGKELPSKATGINEPVLPCVICYGVYHERWPMCFELRGSALSS